MKKKKYYEYGGLEQVLCRAGLPSTGLLTIDRPARPRVQLRASMFTIDPLATDCRTTAPVRPPAVRVRTENRSPEESKKSGDPLPDEFTPVRIKIKCMYK